MCVCVHAYMYTSKVTHSNALVCTQGLLHIAAEVQSSLSHTVRKVAVVLPPADIHDKGEEEYVLWPRHTDSGSQSAVTRAGITTTTTAGAAHSKSSLFGGVREGVDLRQAESPGAAELCVAGERGGACARGGGSPADGQPHCTNEGLGSSVGTADANGKRNRGGDPPCMVPPVLAGGGLLEAYLPRPQEQPQQQPPQQQQQQWAWQEWQKKQQQRCMEQMDMDQGVDVIRDEGVLSDLSKKHLVWESEDEADLSVEDEKVEIDKDHVCVSLSGCVHL